MTLQSRFTTWAAAGGRDDRSPVTLAGVNVPALT
jgi:hypothetical protein